MLVAEAFADTDAEAADLVQHPQEAAARSPASFFFFFFHEKEACGSNSRPPASCRACVSSYEHVGAKKFVNCALTDA